MRSRITRVVLLLALGASSAAGQSGDDGRAMRKGMLSAGVVYAHDSWDQYWEGTLKRANGNIGTLTQQRLTLVGAYGVTNTLSLMATVPYVWTHASQGVLHDLRGIQDLSVAAKVRLITTGGTAGGAFSAFVVGTAAVPVSDYTPDFFPLSIGTGGGRASGRLTIGYESTSAWFLNASSAYTWCSNVTLNRNSYYTDGQLYLTNEVAMPNVLEHTVTAGVSRGRLRIPVSVVQQRTLGGGDIRRQDMPFVSNRMDFTKLEGGMMYALPKNFSLRLGAAHVLRGRNVGQSTTIMSGLFYGHQF